MLLPCVYSFWGHLQLAGLLDEIYILKFFYLGWHFHKNADTNTKNMKKMQRSDDISVKYGNKKKQVQDRNGQESKLSIKVKKFKNRKLRPQGSPNKKKEPRPKMIKFTAEDAIEKEVDGADSSNRMSITPFYQQRYRSGPQYPHQSRHQDPLSRHKDIFIPEKSARRIDQDSVKSAGVPSYKITPNLKSGGYKISPVVKKLPQKLRKPQKKKPRRLDKSPQRRHPSSKSFRQTPYQSQNHVNQKGSWLLKSPNGIEFRFKSLQQIFDLNQNNFVPG